MPRLWYGIVGNKRRVDMKSPASISLSWCVLIAGRLWWKEVCCEDWWMSECICQSSQASVKCLINWKLLVYMPVKKEVYEKNRTLSGTQVYLNHSCMHVFVPNRVLGCLHELVWEVATNQKWDRSCHIQSLSVLVLLPMGTFWPVPWFLSS